MKERRAITLGERWRREANRGVDDNPLPRKLGGRGKNRVNSEEPHTKH